MIPLRTGTVFKEFRGIGWVGPGARMAYETYQSWASGRMLSWEHSAAGIGGRPPEPCQMYNHSCPYLQLHLEVRARRVFIPHHFIHMCPPGNSYIYWRNMTKRPPYHSNIYWKHTLYTNDYHGPGSNVNCNVSPAVWKRMGVWGGRIYSLPSNFFL